MDMAKFSIIIDNVRSAQNIGSIFRTADAFACSHIYLTGISATPPNKEILKTALGATESVSWSYLEDPAELIKKIKLEPGYQVICLEQTPRSEKLQQFVPKQGLHYVIIAGNEVDGVNQSLIDLSDYCLEIPQSGIKKSLNVAVAAGICLWHFYTASLSAEG